MSWQSWAQLLGLLMAALLILPAALRLPWRSRRILTYIAIWLAIFAAVGLLIQLLQ
ncbi:hypothetical protein [Ferrovibrio sp.]|uniref:hypothetical protein n=1 Tax=Ferrovibrio sp. TaxID=1917215 RepID=UPI001B5BE74E|nr:hypothetical protein [Ferrovibrio sp.]MBP7065816.1 hypothetical protein [Ferrovibrio sp.]